LFPGDVAIVIAGDFPASNEFLNGIRAELGLNLPLPEQLWIYLTRVLTGNLGYSYISHQSVVSLIFDRLPLTMLLVLSSLALATIVGVILGVLSSGKPHSIMDLGSSFVSLIGFSIPVFWLGQVLLLFFAVRYAWFPGGGVTDVRQTLTGFPLYADILYHLALPAFVLTLAQLALVTRLARASMIDALSQDYITWARAKGVSERMITFKHALRNALLPVVTLTGYSIGYLFSGAVLIENVFSWPGLGRLLVLSISQRDYPVLTGQLIFISMTVILANFITDIVYRLLDPRIQHS